MIDRTTEASPFQLGSRGNLAILPEQSARLDYTDMQVTLARLSAGQRKALLPGEGVSYEETAQICSTIPTKPSRSNLAFAALGPQPLCRHRLFPSDQAFCHCFSKLVA